MGRTLILILTLMLFASCRQSQQFNKFIFKPTAEPLSKYSDQTLDETFFNENHYSYSEWAKVDSLEKLTGAFVDATTGQTVLDTTKYFYSSETFVIEQGDTTFLRTCKTTLTDTILKFVLNDEPFSQRNTELEIVKSGSSFKSNYLVTAVPTDSSYKLPTFTALTQNILLDKENYSKGDQLKGKINLTVKAFYPMSNTTDTIKIFGLLKTMVD
jgi:hypothetical protein